MKDYYSVLGVLPSADTVVIKAVFKALALKYHPDRNVGDAADNSKRMTDVNEAYAILSNTEKREAYDKDRQGTFEQGDFSESEQAGFSSNVQSNEVDKSWSVVCKYYSDFDEIIISLNQISASLVYPYKLVMLDKKEFDKRREVADKLIAMYLETYFGKNRKIKSFAYELLVTNRRDMAKELNKAVKVFGNRINAEAVIFKIEEDAKIIKQSVGDDGEVDNLHYSPQHTNQIAPWKIHAAIASIVIFILLFWFTIPG
jgi:curved DNA-binding protein CbpA